MEGEHATPVRKPIFSISLTGRNPSGRSVYYTLSPTASLQRHGCGAPHEAPAAGHQLRQQHPQRRVQPSEPRSSQEPVRGLRPAFPEGRWVTLRMAPFTPLPSFAETIGSGLKSSRGAVSIQADYADSPWAAWSPGIYLIQHEICCGTTSLINVVIY